MQNLAQIHMKFHIFPNDTVRNYRFVYKQAKFEGLKNE